MVGAHSTTENNFITLSLSFRKLNSMYKKRLPGYRPSRLLLPASQDDYLARQNQSLLAASTAITAHGDYTVPGCETVMQHSSCLAWGWLTARSCRQGRTFELDTAFVKLMHGCYSP